MSKPLGMSFGLDEKGVPRLSVPSISATEDAIWNAVEEALGHGWTVQMFKAECAEAWNHYIRRQQQSDAAEWRKP